MKYKIGDKVYYYCEGFWKIGIITSRTEVLSKKGFLYTYKINDQYSCQEDVLCSLKDYLERIIKEFEEYKEGE